MRRTEEILQIINDEANKHSELNSIQKNTASVAWWKFIKDIFALSVQALETIITQNRQEIEAKIAQQNNIGTIGWYKDMVLGFQYGDDLIVKNNQLQYAVTHPSKQIIKRVNAYEIFDADQSSTTFGNFYVHLYYAKEGAGGRPVRLSTEENNAFATYLAKMKIAGTNIVWITADSSLVFFRIKVKVKKEVFNADGSLISDGSFPVIDVVKKYINEKYDSNTISIADITTAIKNIEGVASCFVPNIIVSHGATIVDGQENPIDSDEMNFGYYFSFVEGSNDTLNQYISYELV